MNEALRGLCELVASLETLDDPLGACETDSRPARADVLLHSLKRAVSWLRELEDAAVPVELSDVCFAGLLELSRAAASLSAPQRGEEALVNRETALRKLRRALHAVLDVAEASGALPPGTTARRRHQADLGESLAVRRLYAHFRRQLRRPERDCPDAVLAALRYAAGALATLIASPEYAYARLSDRALLRRLQERLLAWARGSRPVDAGLQLLDDVWTSADLLRGVNQRQELRAHDLQLARSLSAELGAEPGGWLARLRALFGLDDRIDAVLDRASAGSQMALVAEARARLLELHGSEAAESRAAREPSPLRSLASELE